MRSAGSALALIAILSIASADAATPPVFESKWGSIGSGDGEFNSPTGTALDGAVLPAGRHQWVWDRWDDYGRRVPPGMYFYTLASPRFTETRKAVVVE